MDNQHTYQVQARWTRDRVGIAEAGNIPRPIEFAAPPEFQGESGKWTPEHFLVAAVVSCFLLTFRGIADRSKLQFSDLEIGAQGVLRQEPPLGWRFVQIELSPLVTLVCEEDHDLAAQVLQKALQSCLVGRALVFPVTMVARINNREPVAL
jgi:organic hydroperoxide reductase OsmC/OhrA